MTECYGVPKKSENYIEYLVSEATYLRGMPCAQQLPPPEWEKELKREQQGGVVVNGLMIFNNNYENLCWRFEDRLPKTGATGRQE